MKGVALTPEQKCEIIRRGLLGDELVSVIARDFGISPKRAGVIINRAKVRRYKPRGRPAHSVENRVGQAWRPEKVLKEGVDVFGNKKVFLVEEGHFRCRCGAIVRIDKNGFAACEMCGEVYNDSKTIRGTEYHMSKAQKKKALEEFKASVVNHKD
jgi:hypothetical protein